MGEQLAKYRLRKEARRRFDLLNDNRDKYIIIHYSCESFYDIKDGRTPRVTSIAARSFSSGQTISFSIHKSAEQLNVPLSEITEHYDKLERFMLDEYFDFLRSRHGYHFVHWNMRDINYGFQAIEHRYKVLGGEPCIIDDSRKFDLARELIARFGVCYAPHGNHGRLHSIMEMNSITARDVLTGKEEAIAFEEGAYVKLHQSTLRKVDVMANILERTLDGSLKTKAKWCEKNGFHLAALVQYMAEAWMFRVIAIIAAFFGFVASCKAIFYSQP